MSTLQDINISSRAGLKSKRGRNKIENNLNECCRLCKKSLRLTYGQVQKHESYANWFKPPRRKDDYGITLAESLREIGITVLNLNTCLNSRNGISNNTYWRKLRHWRQTYLPLPPPLPSPSPGEPATQVKIFVVSWFWNMVNEIINSEIIDSERWTAIKARVKSGLFDKTS